MPRTPAGGTSTREKLMMAAEQLFATQGVDGTHTRDIVRLAGQANPSAVQYHFGSREALLSEVLRERRERAERALAERLPRADGRPLAELLSALIDAEATELRTERGRRCLRISAQISRHSGIGTREPHPAGSGYERLTTALEPPLGNLPEPIRRERIDLALTLIGAAMAERARQLADGETPQTGEQVFLADLASMTGALLTAPPPAGVSTTPGLD